jgi:K+-transporting ATPase KdpF subunit
VQRLAIALCNTVPAATNKCVCSSGDDARHASCSNTGHDGSGFHHRDLRLLRDRARLRLGVHKAMTPWELIMGSIMAAALTGYLVYAMLRPEKF